MRIFHFPLRAHRAITRSAGGSEPASPVPIPRQLVLVRDEDLASLRVRDDDSADDLAGRREARTPERERQLGAVIDLTHW